MSTPTDKIWIIGDSPLVEEYAAACIKKGFDTRVRINENVEIPGGVMPLHESDVSTGLVLELTNISRETKRATLEGLDELLPAEVPIITSAVTVTMGEQCTWVKNPDRLVGIGAFPTLLDNNRVEIVAATRKPARPRDEALAFIGSLNKRFSEVGDSVGMVMPRILSMLINEACFALAEKLADHNDIDTAMRLGTNYPSGPVEWGHRIGPKHVYAVVAALHEYFGEDRYRPAPFLRQAALRNRFL